MKKSFSILLVLLFSSIMLEAQNPFVHIQNGQFIKNGKPYYFLGTNFWYGMNLASKGAGGDRDRLIRELDHLQTLGIKNLRIMAASEGPDDEPWRMLPSLQPEAGKYNRDLLDGLDFLLAEMGKRDMTAVLCLNNFWPWSGGMAQYVAWFDEKPIPYPPPAEGGDWLSYQLYTARFYSDEKALNAYLSHIAFLINRINPYNGLMYKNDPTIFSWQLANEPRGITKGRFYRNWIEKTAAYIKSLDDNHLVSIGSEGKTPSSLAGNRFRRDHSIKGIDYTTIHIWVQNWGWYDPDKHDSSYPKALETANKYLEKHIRQAKRMGKPIVLEEFGIGRDLGDHDPAATTSARNQYYRDIFGVIAQAAEKERIVAGCNFWAWGGEGRPREPHAIWQAGDDFIGDPPHEYQGWYSVYDKDESTLDIIREFSGRMNSLTFIDGR